MNNDLVKFLQKMQQSQVTLHYTSDALVSSQQQTMDQQLSLTRQQLDIIHFAPPPNKPGKILRVTAGKDFDMFNLYLH